MRSGWPELRRSDLRSPGTPSPMSQPATVPNLQGRDRQRHRHDHPVAAFYYAANGDIQLLEPLPGARR